jgi:hypothetical protein
MANEGICAGEAAAGVRHLHLYIAHQPLDCAALHKRTWRLSIADIDVSLPRMGTGQRQQQVLNDLAKVG